MAQAKGTNMKKSVGKAAPSGTKADTKTVTVADAAAEKTTQAFLAEVDAALQQERLMGIWQKYRVLFITGVCGLLLAVAGSQAWEAWQQHRARTLAAEWYEWSKISADETRREKLTEFLVGAHGGYRTLAAFTQAEMQSTAVEKARAYALIYKDSGQPAWLANLAKLNAAMALLGSDDAAAKGLLEELAAEGMQAQATYPLALELLALTAQRENNSVAAREYTVKLLEQPQLTPQLRQRALMRMGVLSTLVK